MSIPRLSFIEAGPLRVNPVLIPILLLCLRGATTAWMYLQGDLPWPIWATAAGAGSDVEHPAEAVAAARMRIEPSTAREILAVISGVTLAMTVLILLGGLHLRATGFGLLQEGGESVYGDTANFQRRQIHRVDLFCFVHLATAGMSFFELAYSKTLPSDGPGAAVARSPAVTKLLICAPYFLASRCLVGRASLIRVLRGTLRLIPVIALTRICVVIFVFGGRPFTAEHVFAARSPQLVWGWHCSVNVSILYFASTVDASLLDIFVCYGFFAVRAYCVSGDWACTLLPVALGLSCPLSVWVLRPRIMRWRKADKAERVDAVEEIAYAASTPLGGDRT